MLLRAHLGFIISVLCAVPLQSGRGWQDNHRGTAIIQEHTKWSLDELPDPNTTDHLVFETVYSLLQFWPNARIRNGHSVVPGIIPEGTLLYHGTNYKEPPLGPEWVALDPEYAYYYCRRPPCWQITFVTTRPLKIVYFDGKSASKNPHGSLDTQDLLVWGESRLEHQWDETARAEKLCEWGIRFGIDGFVRMKFNFEVIICDFTSGIGLISSLNTVHGFGLLENISYKFMDVESLIAGGWHNHFPGETRVQLDLAGLVSFYDTQLVPSLVAIRDGQERWEHRAQDVSKEDLSAVVSRLEAALTRTLGPSSGIEWQTLIQVVVDRYTGRLELMQHLLSSPITSLDKILDLAIKTQIQLRIILAPYLHFSSVPTDTSDKAALGWTAPIFKDCTITHTRFAMSKLGSMTNSEKLLLRAVQGTNREICRVVTKMWVAGVYAGIDPSLSIKGAIDIAQVTRVWHVWEEDLNRLMAWLDWHVWIRCNPNCGPEETCIFHEWPVTSTRPTKEETGRSRAVAMGSESPTEELPVQPRCVS